MAKGKAKPNAFLFFMRDWKKQQEALGRTFPNGLKDVQMDPDANREWKSLSEQEKLYYKEMAKGSDAKSSKKKTGTGEYIELIEQAEAKEKEFRDNMVENISQWIKISKFKKGLSDYKFYLIHINFFYFRTLDNNEMEYYPAEISVGQFSLREGAIKIYHQIINEKIKIGFTSSAKEQSDKVHQIPLEAPFGKSSYIEIFNDICRFLQPGKIDGEFPPLYTLFSMEDVYCPTKSVLSRLATANSKPEDFFTLYSFEDFFTIMHNSLELTDTSQPFEPVVALIEIKKDPYAYRPALACEFHEKLKSGTLHCSQSRIKRWFFTLAEFCCKPLGINMIIGVHLPKEVQLEEIGILNSTLSSLNLNSTSRIADSTVSLSEISLDGRKHEKVHDSRRYRAEASKPFEPYDNKKSQEPIVERPLRPPLTKSTVMNFDSTDTESIDYSENSLPSVGRGAIKKRPLQNNKPSMGHGYPNTLKS